MPFKNYCIFFLFIFLRAGTHAQKPIRVLIIDGYSNHDWKQTSSITKNILEESGLFKAAVSTAPANSNTDSLAAWNRLSSLIKNG